MLRYTRRGYIASSFMWKEELFQGKRRKNHFFLENIFRAALKKETIDTQLESYATREF